MPSPHSDREHLQGDVAQALDDVAPDLSNPIPGGYGGGRFEYARLERAMSLDRKAALESASWGLGQVMGFNAPSLGYADVEAMIGEFNAGEDGQLLGCARFINANPPLKRAFGTQDWTRVAFFYNGRNFAANGYDAKLEAAYRRFSDETPDVEVRANQARLAYVAFDPGAIDGIAGDATVAALKRFQLSKGLTPSGAFDAPTGTALKAAAEV